ncbi:hypothetical protein GQ457_16G019050 [Hibiscus cannabinus]
MVLVCGPHMEHGCTVWIAFVWMPGNPCFVCCSDDVGCVAASRFRGCLALVSIAGSLVMPHGPCDFGSPLRGGLSSYFATLVAMSLWLVPPLSLPCTRVWHAWHSPSTVAYPAAGGCCLAYTRPMIGRLLCGWDCGARLCATNLLVSSSRGGCRTQGCCAKALCNGWPLVPTIPLAPFLGMQASSFVPFCALGGFSPASCTSLPIVFLWLFCRAPVLAMVCFFGLLDFAHRGLSRTWWLLAWPRLDSWLYFSASMGLWCMDVCCDPARFYAPWWLPHPGVRCQGPPRCQSPLRYQGPACWLVRAARAFGLGCFGPCHGWSFPAQLRLPFPVAWCANSRSRAALRVLHCLSRKSPSCFLLLFLQGFLVQGFFKPYKSFFFSSHISHCRAPLLCRYLLSPFSFFFAFLYYSLYMAESLLAMLGDLNFTADEQDAVVVVPETVAIPTEDFACSLVGCVLSSGPLDGGRVARLFRTIWKDDKVQTITEINPNFFLIAFASSSHRDNVLKRGPWDFQKQWFALEPADPTRTIHDYAFQYMCIWVRIHNIPLSLMTEADKTTHSSTEALASTLGACIGKVVMTDTRLEDGNMGEFLRVRVSLDTTKPLRRCVTLSRSNAKAIMCPLQYERVPIFCQGCGLIGHTILQCPTTPQGDDQKLQYGAWLRAPQPKRPTVARPHGRVSVVKDADLPPLSPAPLVSSSPPASASTATASVPAPAASDAETSVPVLAPVVPASSGAPLASGCTFAVSAPLPAHSTRVLKLPLSRVVLLLITSWLLTNLFTLSTLRSPAHLKEPSSNWTWKRPLIGLSGPFLRLLCYGSVLPSPGWI